MTDGRRHRPGITIRPDDEEYAALAKWSEWTGLPMNQLTRHALRLMMGLPAVYSINPPPSSEAPEKPTPPGPE